MLHLVAPLVGAWIEIFNRLLLILCKPVAPLVGAWIEITSPLTITILDIVAPLVGAWIEIILMTSVAWVCTWSLPSWERGLKSCDPWN